MQPGTACADRGRVTGSLATSTIRKSTDAAYRVSTHGVPYRGPEGIARLASASQVDDRGADGASADAKALGMAETARSRVELGMNEIDRIVDSIVRSDVPLERGAVAVAAEHISRVEAPLAPRDVVDRAVDAVIGLGPIEPLLRDPRVSDVLVNGPDDIWMEVDGKLTRTDVRYETPEAVIAAVRRVISPLGLRLDRATPAVDARLPDGSRLHAIIPPASVDGPVVAIRRFTQAVQSLDDLVAAGGLVPAGAAVMAEAVDSRSNILVSGATGSGKTTLLNILASAIESGDRIVTIEDAAELSVSGHVVRLEAHPPNVEGVGEITIRSLLTYALRLRPDRIIVGEVRGIEAADMIQALNTGHAGSMSTVHANGPMEALDRLEVLASGLGLGGSPETIRSQVMSAFDLLIHVSRRSGLRFVESIHGVLPDGLEEVYRC
jgi:pilus assembly protein CpaF